VRFTYDEHRSRQKFPSSLHARGFETEKVPSLVAAAFFEMIDKRRSHHIKYM
jgi:hypothetical protein